MAIVMQTCVRSSRWGVGVGASGVGAEEVVVAAGMGRRTVLHAVLKPSPSTAETSVERRGAVA